MFVGTLACGAAVFLFFFTDYVFDFADYVDPYGGVVAGVILAIITYGTLPACIWELWRALKTLEAGIRFSRLLRRPSDARTATVLALERGGRTLTLDTDPRDGTGRGDSCHLLKPMTAPGPRSRSRLGPPDLSTQTHLQ